MDSRFVYGASCTFFGAIGEVKSNGGLPCCPFCGGMLMEYENADPWWAQADSFEAGTYSYPQYMLAKGPQPPDWKPRPHPGYRKMLEWAKTQPKCYKHPAHMKNSYRKHVGIDVDLTP